jgi:cyclopropane fatty-acyl-phospholipid synthase-like methyltransferase
MIRRFLFELMYWFRRTPWDTGVTPPEVVEFVSQQSSGSAIDLGCGTGTNALYLAKHGWDVLGVDFSKRAIRAAQRKTHAKDLAVEFRQADVTRLDGVEGPFDLALDIGCFHSLPLDRRRQYADRVGELVAPGGTFLLYAWLPPEDDSTSSHPSQEEVTSLFGPQLEPVNIIVGSEGWRRSAWYTFMKNA